MSLVTPFLVEQSSWQLDALCQEYPDINFFPERGEPTAPAKEVCRRCLVVPECLEAALATLPASDWGIWGGTSLQERKAIRRQRSRALDELHEPASRHEELPPDLDHRHGELALSSEPVSAHRVQPEEPGGLHERNHFCGATYRHVGPMGGPHRGQVLDDVGEVVESAGDCAQRRCESVA